MVIETKLPDLLSLLESHVGDATPEIAVVLRPPTPILPPPPPQLKLNQLTRNERGIKRVVRALPRKGRSKKKLLLNKLRLPE